MNTDRTGGPPLTRNQQSTGAFSEDNTGNNMLLCPCSVLVIFIEGLEEGCKNKTFKTEMME